MGIFDLLGTEAKAKIKGKGNSKEIKLSFGQSEEEENECTNCGRKNIKVYAKCQYKGLMGNRCIGGSSAWVITNLCKDCANQCKDCKKFYCPKHINKHRC